MPKKWVLFSLLTFLLLLLVSFQMILQSGFIAEKAKRYSEASVERLLGRKAHIDRVHLRLFSASAAFEGVALPPTVAGAEPPFFAKEIRIYFNPWSLLTQAFIIRKIVVVGPILRLTPEVLAERPLSFKGAPAVREIGAPPVIVRRIEIEEGAFFYRGEGALKEIALKRVAAQIEPDFFMRQFEIQISGEEGSVSMERGERTLDQTFGAGPLDKTFGSWPLDRLQGKLSVLPDRIQIKEAAATSGRSALRIDGVLPYEKDWDLRIDVDLPLQEVGLPPLHLPSGEKNLSGEAKAQGRLTGRYPDMTFTGKVSLPHLLADGLEIGSLASEISYQNRRARLGALSGTLFAGAFSGEGEGSYSNNALSYRLTLQYRRLPLERIYGAVEGSANEIDQALQGIFAEGSLSVAGRGFTKEDLTAEGEIALKRLPLFSAPVPAEAPAPAQLVALFQEGGLRWKWSEGRLTVDRGSARLPRTEAAFQGSWNAPEGLRLSTLLDSADLRPVAAPLHLPLTGAIRLEGTLTGALDRPLFQGQVALEKWTLQGQSFGALSSELAYQDRQWTFRKGSLEAPGVRKKGAPPPYRFEGTLRFGDPSPTFEFRIETASADPQEVLSFFKLSIPFQTRASGPLRVEGTPKIFSVRGPLVLEKGTLYGESFDRGSLELTVNQKEVLFKKVVLEKGKRRLQGEGSVQYQGTFRVALKTPSLRLQETRYFQSAAPALAGDVALEVEGRGSFQKPQLKIVMETQNLNFGETETGAGVLRVDWNDREIQCEGNFPDRELSLKGTVRLIASHPFSLQGRFKRLRVDPFFRDRLSGPLSKMVLLLSGRIEGEGTLSEIEKSRVAASFTEFSADFGGYPVQNDGPIALGADQGVFRFESARFKGENTALEFNGGGALLKSWDLFVKGEADLNLIKFFTKEIASGKGKATLDVRVSDQWSNPRVRGEISLQNGVIRTGFSPQSIHISRLTVVFSERRLLLETLEGEMGRGKFHGSGKADLIGLGLGEFTFVLELADARMRLFQDLSANINGEILFKGNGTKQSLQGELTLTRAVYEKKVDLKSLVPELRQKREEEISSETPVVGGAELNVHLFGRENIWINNNVAKVPLEVDLFLKGTFDHPLILGRIDIPRGSVYFRRNEFRVLAGSVDFLNSEKIDPTFDFKAKTQVKDQETKYDIDLSLSGRLSQFTLSLTSSPPLPEPDILALLTVGKTTQEIVQGSKGGGAEITSFVVSELLEEPAQKSGVVDRIQVDPYTNGPKASSGTRLTAEKKLWEDRLLVTYSITLDPAEEQKLRMIYELSKNVSLVGERDENGRIGGDIQFRFEFR